MIAKLKDLTKSLDGQWVVTFTTQTDFREAFDDLKKGEVSVEIKKACKKRSLTANAYAWVLMDQIAAKVGRKVVDVYREAIRDVGGISTVIGMKDIAIPAFRQSWEVGHLGRQIEIIPGSPKDGWSNVKIYFGSSEFDSEQMSRFIGNLIQDAESLGIPTLTEEQARKMLVNWSKKQATTADADSK